MKTAVPSTRWKLYQPGSGSEGERFMDVYCHQCAKMPHSSDAKSQCMIQMRTFIYKPTDAEYPREWCYDTDGNPICTAFKSREEHNAERRAKRSPVIAKDTDTIDMFS